MMSNKWTFSLTTLITILALVFVVAPVIAGDFSTAISVVGHDISHADGEQREVGTTVLFNVTFGKVVTTVAGAAPADNEEFAPGDIILQAYDEDGAVVDITATPPTIAAGVPANGMNYVVTVTITDVVRKLYFQIPKGKVGAADPTVGDDDDANEKKDITVTLLPENPASPALPDVLKVERVGEPYATITSAEFMVHVLLTEEPKGGLTKDHLALTELDFGSIVKLASPSAAAVALMTFPAVDRNGDNDNTDTGEAAIAAGSAAASWRDGMLHLYLVTLKTKPGEKTAVVGIKSFAGMENPAPGAGQEMYNMLSGEGRDQLTVKTKRDDPQTPKAAGLKFSLPKDKVIPAGGYLVVAEDKAGSSVHVPGGAIDKSPLPHERNARELVYNVIDDGDLPNLETFLANGGVIGVMGPHALVITEIMWGSDASLDDPGKSQWIELYNTGAEYKTQDGDNTTYLIFYDSRDTLPTGLHDTAGTTPAIGPRWHLTGKGQSGASGKRITSDKDVEATVQLGTVQPIISMYRVMDASGTLEDGRMEDSWRQSTESTNFEANAPGVHTGTPGAMTDMTALRMAEAAKTKAEADAAAAKAAADAKKAEGTGTVPEAGQIYISEIMFAGGGVLPQWIEIANGSRTEEVNLSGWTLTVDNAVADADVSVGSSIMFTIPAGTKIGMFGQNDTPNTLLIVTETGRNNLPVGAPMLNLWQSSQTELILAGVTKRRYSLLSGTAFQITLAPPAPTKTVVPATATAAQKAKAKADDSVAAMKHKAATDIAGNLGADGAAAWALPMSEDGRSSIIRRHIQVSVGPAEPEDGSMMDSWISAADTSFAQVTHIRVASHYGAANDVGTPGFRAGGALPVELSHFRPARDKATGAAVITWATESELNNAGFFIKRSQQRNGEFKVINATMVPGAGTTSEKQFYTYTDTTAQPNVVYYYQIEDVSLDGNRQTLTRGIRLKGHVGAAGKATVIWGELKTSHE